VQLGYISVQLGHADVSVTARHYARWIERDRYRAPMVLEPGELPADLLARLSDPTSDPSAQSSVIPETDKARQGTAALHQKMVELRGIEPLTLRLPERRKGEK
jgi:hypothetical protein